MSWGTPRLVSRSKASDGKQGGAFRQLNLDESHRKSLATLYTTSQIRNGAVPGQEKQEGEFQQESVQSFRSNIRDEEKREADEYKAARKQEAQ